LLKQIYAVTSIGWIIRRTGQKGLDRQYSIAPPPRKMHSLRQGNYRTISKNCAIDRSVINPYLPSVPLLELWKKLPNKRLTSWVTHYIRTVSEFQR